MCTTNGGSDDVEWNIKFRRFVVVRHLFPREEKDMETDTFSFLEMFDQVVLSVCMFVCVYAWTHVANDKKKVLFLLLLTNNRNNGNNRRKIRRGTQASMKRRVWGQRRKEKSEQNPSKRLLVQYMNPKKSHKNLENGLERQKKMKKKTRKSSKRRSEKKKKNQKNFNSFIHSINIILDMVFLYTLYIFKGTYTRSMDCGVKKVCEGLRHRMVRASSTVRCSPPPPFNSLSSPEMCFLVGAMHWVYATNKWGNRKKSNNNKKKKRKTTTRVLRSELMHWVYGFLLKANERKEEKKLYIQTYRCVYISFSAWALNDVIAGIRRVNPKISPSLSRFDDEEETNSRVLIRSEICVPYIVNVLFFI